MKRRLLCAMLLTGCAKAPEKVVEKAPEFFVPVPATVATVEGKVTYDGPLPAKKRISMDAEAECQKLHPEPVYEASLVVGTDRALANAFVYIKSGLEGKTFPPPTTVVEINQQGCQFAPRIVGLRKLQTISVKNSDPVSHNIHPMPVNNREWNQQQSPGTPNLTRRFGFPEVMIPVKCNVHAWMRSYIAVLEHPYFAVTGSDGSYRFENLPPGQYVVAVWHEKLGELTQPLTVAPKSSGQLSFLYHQK